MKKTLKTLLALMAGTMALAACSDDAIVENNIPQEPEQEVSKLVPMTFTAHQENEGDTRTTIDGTSIKWSELDKISIFDGSAENCGNQCFELKSGAGTTSGEFQGNAAEGAETYYALYPYSESVILECNSKDIMTNAGISYDVMEGLYNQYHYLTGKSKDDVLIGLQHYGYTPLQQAMAESFIFNKKVTFGPQLNEGSITQVQMPAVQTVAEGEHVDASAMLMMAKSTEGATDLKFKNVVSYFKFTAPFNCSKVQIFDNAGAGKMAGTVTLTYNDGNPTANVTANGTSSVTLTGDIVAGETYYIATLPQTFSQGISMFFVNKDDGKEYVKRTTSSYQLGRNKVSNMGTPALTSENLFDAPYVTFSAASTQTLNLIMCGYDEDVSGWAINRLEYSVGGEPWAPLGSNTVTFGGDGYDIRLRGSNGYGTADMLTPCMFNFGNDTKVTCTGDIRTLIDYSNYETVNTANARFERLFSGCKQLTSAPALPATELASGCYECMFYGCNSLTTAPELPATTLAERCYANMFAFCTSLTTAPELPATTLAEQCYLQMFWYCSNLTTAPELPATTLVYRCYFYMFLWCQKLNYVKAAFTTTPGDNYTLEWLKKVASTGTFVKSPNATWNVTGENGVPAGWTVDVDYGPSVAWESALTLGKSEATNIVLEVCVDTKPAGAHDLNSAGTLWEVLDGTTLRIQSSQGKIIGQYDPYDYGGLFQDYSKAETITGLDKLATEDMTTMALMFSGCEALTSVDVSSFNTAKVTSMDRMFEKCRSLTSLDLRSFNTTNLTDMYKMFLSCESMTSLDLSSFNTAKVTDMFSLFYHNFVLKSLKLSSNFTLGAVTQFGVIFDGTGIRLYPDKGIIYGVTDEAIKTKLKGFFESNLLVQDNNTSMKFDGE